MELGLPADPTEVLGQWTELLRNLSNSKDSISRTAKFAIENSYVAAQLFESLLKRMSQYPPKRKINFFYLLDAIGQNAKAKGLGEYVELISQYIDHIICTIVPRDGEEEREKILSTVNKVLDIWEQRDVIPLERISFAKKQLEVKDEEYRKEKAEVERMEKLEAMEREEKRKKRKLEEKMDDETRIRMMEEFRSKSKEQRREKVLRPKDDPPDGEFNEMWEKTTVEDIRQLIPDYDKKLQKLSHPFPFGIPPAEEDMPRLPPFGTPSPFSPAVLSSPSPSPTTPYSPSSQKHPTQETKPYSPSSPSSSPEHPSQAESFLYSGEKGKPYVFIWDLDETLILLNSLINGDFAQTHNLPKDVVIRAGKKAEEYLRKIIYDHLFFRDLKDLDINQVDALKSSDDGRDLSRYNFTMESPHICDHTRLAYRLRRAMDLYSHSDDFWNQCSYSMQTRMETTFEEIDKVANGWLTVARNLVKAISEHADSINVLVSSAHLIPTLAKLLFYRLERFFDIKNVYSAGSIGKSECIKMVLQRFPTSKVIVVGDGAEEEEASKRMNIPFRKVSKITDLASIYAQILTGIEAIWDE